MNDWLIDRLRLELISTLSKLLTSCAVTMTSRCCSLNQSTWGALLRMKTNDDAACYPFDDYVVFRRTECLGDCSADSPPDSPWFSDVRRRVRRTVRRTIRRTLGRTVRLTVHPSKHHINLREEAIKIMSVLKVRSNIGKTKLHQIMQRKLVLRGHTHQRCVT